MVVHCYYSCTSFSLSPECSFLETSHSYRQGDQEQHILFAAFEHNDKRIRNQLYHTCNGARWRTISNSPLKGLYRHEAGNLLRFDVCDNAYTLSFRLLDNRLHSYTVISRHKYDNKNHIRNIHHSLPACSHVYQQILQTWCRCRLL